MSKPDITPKQTVSGIAVDPNTLERVIPETRRPDGSVRKQLKVRPGFTPQEDVSRFRGSRQQQFDKNQLPKGHIIGWMAPSGEKKPGAASGSGGEGGEKGLSASAAKKAKKKAKKQAEKDQAIRKAWDEDSDEDKRPKTKGAEAKTRVVGTKNGSENGKPASTTSEKPKSTNATTTEATTNDSGEGDALAEELEKKLDVH